MICRADSWGWTWSLKKSRNKKTHLGLKCFWSCEVLAGVFFDISRRLLMEANPDMEDQNKLTWSHIHGLIFTINNPPLMSIELKSKQIIKTFKGPWWWEMLKNKFLLSHKWFSFSSPFWFYVGIAPLLVIRNSFKANYEHIMNRRNLGTVRLKKVLLQTRRL